MATIGALFNAFLLLPAYAYFMSTPDVTYTVSDFVYLGTLVNPLVTNLFSFIMFAVVPFNIVKGILTGTVVVLIYKRISMLIKAKDAFE
jgi:riboflavin transporter FmnP